MHRVTYGDGSGGRGGKADLGRCSVFDHDARRIVVGVSMLWASFDGCEDGNGFRVEVGSVDGFRPNWEVVEDREGSMSTANLTGYADLQKPISSQL